jgi:energy-converting hydrogenase Eha subunit C
MCLACIFSLLPAFVMSSIAVFVSNSTGSRKHTLAVRLLPLSQMLFVFFMLSFFFLGIAVALMGYGCGYERDAWITAISGSITTVLLVLGLARVARFHRMAAEELI